MKIILNPMKYFYLQNVNYHIVIDFNTEIKFNYFIIYHSMVVSIVVTLSVVDISIVYKFQDWRIFLCVTSKKLEAKNYCEFQGLWPTN